jgi:hypothetical protein
MCLILLFCCFYKKQHRGALEDDEELVTEIIETTPHSDQQHHLAIGLLPLSSTSDYTTSFPITTSDFAATTPGHCATELLSYSSVATYTYSYITPEDISITKIIHQDVSSIT